MADKKDPTNGMEDTEEIEAVDAEAVDPEAVEDEERALQQRRKVVVVTGASAGVGRAAARAFGEKGYAVALLARGEERLEDARREVEARGGQAVAIPCDVSNPESVEAAAQLVEEQLGVIDVWVNNAMVTVFSPFEDLSMEEYRRATEVTYLGTVYGTHTALRRMKARNHGTIVQVGSALSYRSIPLQSAYCGAKFAIRGFTDSVRCELIHDKSRVHITMVQLPAINTPQFSWSDNHMDYKPQPVPPIFQPEVAAEAIVFAAENRRRELWVGWSATRAILGAKLANGMLDHLAARMGWEGQLTDKPEDEDRPNNLETPVPGHQGAHGAFDDRARSSSPQLWMSMHRGGLLAGLAAGAAVLIGVGAFFRYR